MRSHDTTNISPRAARQWLTWCALAAVFLVASVMRWDRISMTLASVIVTPAAALFGSSPRTEVWNADLIGFWIAGACWLIIAAYFIYAALHLFRKPDDARTPASLAGIFLALYISIALMAPVLSPFAPETQGDLATARLLRPLTKVWIQNTDLAGEPVDSLTHGISAIAHKCNRLLTAGSVSFTSDSSASDTDAQATMLPLGTDDLGRDVFGRMMHGMRMSLMIATGGVLLTVLIGFSLGCAAGYSGGGIDSALMRITDLFLALPSFFVVLACVAFLGSSVTVLICVLAATGWMSIARMVRNDIASLTGREFVLAARMLGRTPVEILRTHLLPNVLPTLMAAAVLQLANIVLAEAALSFLGLGIQPPTPSLGNMIGESLAYVQDAWWVGAFPGIVLTAFVVAANLVTQRIERTSLSIE